MLRPALLVTLTVWLSAAGAAARHGGQEPGWEILLVSLLLLAALALYIYMRVQEVGLFPFLPATTADEE